MLLSRGSVYYKSNWNKSQPLLRAFAKVSGAVGVEGTGGEPFCLGCFRNDSWRGWALSCKPCLERHRCQGSLMKKQLAQRPLERIV